MPSSVIKAMRYEPETRVLEIAFHGARGMYRYFDVPAEEWAEFCAASSKGTYLNEIFKAKENRYERIVSRSVEVHAPGGEKIFYWGEAGAFDEGPVTGPNNQGK